MPRTRATCIITTLTALGFTCAAYAQRPATSVDAALMATSPLLEAGPTKGHVTGSRTSGCTTVLTLDTGATYTLQLAQRGAAMNAMLMIGDGDDTVGLTFQGDGAREAAAAAEQALAPISDRCSG